MSTGKYPMDEIRGTILLSDHVYPTVNNKFVIAGTLTTFWTKEPVLHIMQGLGVYCRVQVERAGEYQARILLIDTEKPPNHQQIMEMNTKLNIKQPSIPMEFAFQMPGFKVQYTPDHQPQPGKPTVVKFRVWLQVGNKEVASAPLLVVFKYKDDDDGMPDLFGSPRGEE
jgi:hypothetical protein